MQFDWKAWLRFIEELATAVYCRMIGETGGSRLLWSDGKVVACKTRLPNDDWAVDS